MGGEVSGLTYKAPSTFYLARILQFALKELPSSKQNFSFEALSMEG